MASKVIIVSSLFYRAALEKKTAGMVSAALPVRAAEKLAPAQYIRYTPSQQVKNVFRDHPFKTSACLRGAQCYVLELRWRFCKFSNVSKIDKNGFNV